MSEKDDGKKNEDYLAVTSVSPYENVKLQYKTESPSDITESQLRLACLEASLTFHEDEVVEEPSTIVKTAEQFWQFVNSAGQ